MNPLNFLIEENYAQTPDAASKILEASSDEFYNYIIEESTKREKLKNFAIKLAKSATKQALKSKPAKAVGRFIKYTALGGLVP
jgi:hypothetical protein